MTRTPLKFRNIYLPAAMLATIFWLNTGSARADQIVVPNYATNSQVANAAEGEFNEVIRYQAVYGASEFPPYPVVISEIQWRPDTYQAGAVTNATIPNIQINLSTTTNRADHLSFVFSENNGTDDTVIFDGTLVLSTSFITLTNGTTAFDINVPLQTPFTYDPSKGNLLLDVRNFAGGSPSIFDNDIASVSDSVSRIFTTDGNVNDTIAGAGDSAAGVIQITYTPAVGSAATAPSIVLQPMNQLALINSNVIFTASAISATPMTYQWFSEI